jgi:hypothetical protein
MKLTSKHYKPRGKHMNTTPTTLEERARAIASSPHSYAGEDTTAIINELLGEQAVSVKETIDLLGGQPPEYHEQGMCCGLEDRNITDRYEAMEFGWEAAMERVYEEVVTPAKDELSAITALMEPHGAGE